VGCQGDFCQFDLDFLENHEIKKATAKVNTLSEFRARLMDSGGVVVGDDDGGLSSQITQLIKGKSEGGGGVPGMKDRKKKKTKTSKDLLSKSLDSIPLESSHSDGGDGSSVDTLLMVPYRVIIQTRQEMPLVKLQLARYKRGEKGEYVSEESYADLAIGSKLPGHFYKDVPCCLKCFKVYSIITDARDSAMKKLARRKTPERSRSLSPTTSIASIDNKRFSANVNTSSMSTSSSQSISIFNQPAKQPASNEDIKYKESLRSAMEAIDGLTKLDVAEIRTMVKPPAAVEVVVEAVMCLLIGKPLTFIESKKILGSGEAFLTMLQEFRLEDVSDNRLRLVEPYVDNPVFRPENVLTVSFCASKFCAWVLGVVQAARWQRGIGHVRTDMLRPSAGSVVGEIKPDKVPVKKSKFLSSTTSLDESSVEELTFVEKLERKKAKRRQDGGQSTPQISRAKEKSSKSQRLGSPV